MDLGSADAGRIRPETTGPDVADLLALLESSADPIWSVDLDFRVVTSNSAFDAELMRSFGLSGEEGHPPEALPSEAAAIWRSYYKRALADGHFFVEYTCPDGRILKVALYPIVREGRTVGISCFARDITEQKRSEAGHSDAERKYRRIFDEALEGLFQSSLEGRPIQVNRSLARMLGYDSPEEFLATVESIGDQVWADPQERPAYLRKLAENGALLAHECRFKRKDGAIFWVSLNMCQVREAGERILYLEGSIEDITERRRAEEARELAERKYRSIFDGALEGIFQISPEERILSANPALARMLGYESAEELESGAWGGTEWVWSDETEHALFIQQIEAEGFVRGFEGHFKRKDGSNLWASLTCKRVFDDDGRFIHYEGFIEDIADRKATVEALRASEERYRTAFQMTLDSVTINRMSDGVYLDVNKGFTNIIGFEHEEVVGKSSLALNVWADAADRQRMLDAVRRDGVCRSLEAQFRRKSGEVFWGLLSASKIVLDGEPCALSVTRDISEAKMAEDEIRNLAFYDSLTGLPNRRLLLERLRQAQSTGNRSGRNRALLFIDLDDFKTLNDSMGHHMGDMLLQEVGRRLAHCTRESDTVARLGGDEFVVMLEDLSEIAADAASYAQSMGEKILGVLGQPYILDGLECLSTSSIGITVFGDTKEVTKAVLQQADIAMYQAKAAGRNTMRFFAPALQAAVNARVSLEGELRRAIREKQFELWFQPQVERGRLSGAEALIRWNHPERGLLLPGEFISLAEETGLILPMGEWVLETACRQIALWEKTDFAETLKIAVNISPRQFRQPDFVEQVLAILESTGAKAEKLKLELTEGMLVDNIDDVVAKMTRLKMHGLRFSLDDFGTGYSSLSYLNRLPLEQLKIDRSFVRDILVDANSGAIAQAIVSLSRAMGLSVIAEGVETEEQRLFLQRLGCFGFQGYLATRPLPLEKFEQFLRGWLTAKARSV